MVDIESNIDIVKARDLTADPLLAQYATEIHRLGKRVKKDVIAIGHYLDQAQKHAGRGAWHLWVNTEFGWSDQTARRFIHVYELSRDSKFNNLLNSDLPLSALYQLAAPKTPGRARDEVAERVEAGEKVSCAAVTAAIAQAQGKSPSEAEIKTVGAGTAADVAKDPAQADEDEGTAKHRAAMAALAVEPELNSAIDMPEPVGEVNCNGGGTDGDHHHDRRDHDSAKSLKRKNLLAAWDGTPEEQQLIRDLVLNEFFAEAAGADLFERIPGHRLAEVVAAFLDRLGLNGLRQMMSPEFGAQLRSAKPHLKGFKTLHAVESGRDASGKPIFTPQGRGGRSKARAPQRGTHSRH